MAIPGSRIPLPDRPGTPPREGPGPSPGGSRNPSPEGPESVPGPVPGPYPGIGRKPGIGRFPRKRPKLVSSADFETGNSRPWGIAHEGVGWPIQAIPDPPRNPSPDPPLGLPDRVVIGLPGPSRMAIPRVPWACHPGTGDPRVATLEPRSGIPDPPPRTHPGPCPGGSWTPRDEVRDLILETKFSTRIEVDPRSKIYPPGDPGTPPRNPSRTGPEPLPGGSGTTLPEGGSGDGSEPEPTPKKSRKKCPPRGGDPPGLPHVSGSKTLVTLCPEKNVNLAHTYTLVGRVRDGHPGG
jgi:hypothetical protein